MQKNQMRPHASHGAVHCGKRLGGAKREKKKEFLKEEKGVERAGKRGLGARRDGVRGKIPRPLTLENAREQKRAHQNARTRKEKDRLRRKELV